MSDRSPPKLSLASVRRLGKIPVNPYRTRPFMGLPAVTSIADMLDLPIDPGAAGGALFLVITPEIDDETIQTVIDLINEEYALGDLHREQEKAA